MPISYSSENNTIKLDTPNASYVIGICFEEKIPVHLYFGKRVDSNKLMYLSGYDPKMRITSYRDKASIADRLPFEYPAAGLGDFREPCLIAHAENGAAGALFSYVSHNIYPGKKPILCLPATMASENACDTLELLCRDDSSGLEVTLVYNVFSHLDVITRHAVLRNAGGADITLKRAYSAALELPEGDYDIIRLYGSWARERSVSRVPLGYGVSSASSTRGTSSHQSHPFIAAAKRGASYDNGEIYALHLVYSGNFDAAAEKNQFNRVRAVIGVNDRAFSWLLPPGGEFVTPEAVLTYSSQGFMKMTHTLHDLYRVHLLRGKYANARRPILINNWEATYFDFDTEKLLSIAKEAAEAGIELFVLDDGWFGKRDDDNTSLGDWYVNETKLKGGLKHLADEIKNFGMKFGIWMEPEMVSPASDLYAAHPDWALSIPGREPVRSRNQYVLDLTREDVREYIKQSIAATLDSADITYLKWDMNRPITDAASAVTPPGELYHRYVLGLYELQEWLTARYPDLLLENCSGGGGRYDPGMLFYSPQIWCSDNTDAVKRLEIQEGTALLYPISTIGSHVSICPNHVTGRTVPFETRGIVALFGTFGYELDITKLTIEEKAQIPAQIEMCRKYGALIQNGDYYRLASYAENRRYDAWQVVSKDRLKSVIVCVSVEPGLFTPEFMLYPRGLDENLTYTTEPSQNEYTALTLMNAGLPVTCESGDYKAAVIYLRGH